MSFFPGAEMTNHGQSIQQEPTQAHQQLPDTRQPKPQLEQSFMPPPTTLTGQTMSRQSTAPGQAIPRSQTVPSTPSTLGQPVPSTPKVQSATHTPSTLGPPEPQTPTLARQSPSVDNNSDQNTLMGATASRPEWEMCDMQEKNSEMPLGTRVIKGPHWPHGKNDDGVPGTVVAHQDKGQ